jgi:Arc/MetJ-type ribon-helix-helix transcriptional regulator
MTTQIAVRLPDEMVEFLDQLLMRGEAKSRAAAVTRALELDRRRRMAEHDAAIYAGSKERDLDSLAAWGEEH